MCGTDAVVVAALVVGHIGVLYCEGPCAGVWQNDRGVEGSNEPSAQQQRSSVGTEPPVDR